jgi:peptide deformylase
MALRKIRYLGDPVLRKRASEVEAVDDEIRRLIDDMFDTMYTEGGVGLAAPQIGVSKRLVVLDADTDRYGEERIALVNPVIVRHEGEVEEEEGCLSIPELRDRVKRWGTLRVEGLGADGLGLEFDAEGLLCRAIQHEIDHLDGILFIDRVSSLRRELLLNQWKKVKQSLLIEE